MEVTRRLFGTLLAGGLMAATITLLPTPALACGGLFCQRIPVDQAGERILFASDGKTVTAHVQIQYQGDAKNFSWIVPVPSEPTLAVGSDALFQSLRTATRPQFTLTIKDDGNCRPMPVAAAAPVNAGGRVSESDNVTVVSQQEIGPYASAVIQSNDPGALKKWLTANDYVVPDKIDPLLDPYIQGKYYFIALKLIKDRSVGDLQPIVMTYAATKPGVPIRLTGIAATPDMAVYVWLLGKERAIPENYRHATINEARIDWLNNGVNYNQVVTEAMNEAGGQAFVTDFAGDSKVVDASTFNPDRFPIADLVALKDPVAFTLAINKGGYFVAAPPTFSGGFSRPQFFGLPPAQLSFLQRYIPKPESLKQVADYDFYTNMATYQEELAQQTVDTAKAVKELNDTIVKPYGEIKAMLGMHPYLTQLYTTMSPDEMTQDPMFIFNPDLPKVSNMHTATGVRRCSKDTDFFNAPVEITLANGITFTAVRNPGGPGQPGGPVDMPASLRIEQLKASGAASLIADNRNKIIQALGGTTGATASPKGKLPGGTDPSSNTGFGCAGCASSNSAPPPKGQGAGEGLTFAAVMLGFLGWRRWNRRK